MVNEVGVSTIQRFSRFVSGSIAIVRRGDTVYWVTQVSGYGYERYEVLEVKGDEVKSAIATPGGWCG